MGSQSTNMDRIRTSLIVLGVAVCWWGCGQTPKPVVESVRAASERTPVVFVPGVTGVGLRDRITGKPVWGRGKNLISPHDRGYGMARPLKADLGGPDLEPDKVILDLRLFGFVRFKVYQPLVQLFTANGYRHGDLERPRPTDDLFLFAYDWRQDNVDSALLLAKQLERLRRTRGQEHLAVNLVCQSNGAHVCRYFAKYGGLTLEDAESGKTWRPAAVEVDKVILVGTSNGGSIRVLRELDRGRKYVGTIGRFFSPESLYTILSLYQDLPVYTEDLFVDEQGNPMAVELFDAENWRRFEWSIYNHESRARLKRDDLPSWFGSRADRHAYLEQALDRSQRFHRLLQQEVVDFDAIEYHQIMNTSNVTSSRAVLRQHNGRWQTLFADDKEVEQRPELRAAMTVAGDGHATRASQEWLSRQERERIVQEPIQVEGSHRRMILEPATQQSILEILASGIDSERSGP